MLNVLTKVRDRLDQLGADPTPKNTEARDIFPTRDNEQNYAEIVEYLRFAALNIFMEHLPEESTGETPSGQH